MRPLFDPPPARWNLRGDPHLWREMAAAFAAVPPPKCEEALATWVAEAFHRLIGAPLDEAETVFVRRLDHGGMSGGCVSPRYWRDHILPLLLARFRGDPDPAAS